MKENGLDHPCLVITRTQLKQFMPYLSQLALFYMLLDFDAKDRRLIGWIADPNERGAVHVRMIVENTFKRAEELEVEKVAITE